MYLLEWLVSDATKCVIAAGCVVHAILYKNPKKKLQLPRNVNLVLSIILTAFYIVSHDELYYHYAKERMESVNRSSFQLSCYDVIIRVLFYEKGAREPFYFGWQAYVILADTIAILAAGLVLYFSVLLANARYEASMCTEHISAVPFRIILGIIVCDTLLSFVAMIGSLVTNRIFWNAFRHIGVVFGLTTGGGVWQWSLYRLGRLLKESSKKVEKRSTNILTPRRVPCERGSEENGTSNFDFMKQQQQQQPSSRAHRPAKKRVIHAPPVRPNAASCLPTTQDSYYPTLSTATSAVTSVMNNSAESKLGGGAVNSESEVDRPGLSVRIGDITPEEGGSAQDLYGHQRKQQQQHQQHQRQHSLKHAGTASGMTRSRLSSVELQRGLRESKEGCGGSNKGTVVEFQEFHLDLTDGEKEKLRKDNRALRRLCWLNSIGILFIVIIVVLAGYVGTLQIMSDQRFSEYLDELNREYDLAVDISNYIPLLANWYFLYYTSPK
mmetsp:Transcript_16206/g.26759  ORF Transcript_16206/g.26759 Transcript_16206/m.26759 type:complete len:495 (-) Transcript_16206:169-1653(-)